MPQEQKNKEVIYRLNDLVNTGNFDAMDELFDASFVDHNSNRNIKGLSDFKKTIASLRRDFGLNNTIEEVVAADDKVAVRVVSKGRHLVKVFGISPTGKETACGNHEIYRFKNGKIMERWVLSDLAGLMKQLGVKLPL